VRAQIFIVQSERGGEGGYAEVREVNILCVAYSCRHAEFRQMDTAYSITGRIIKAAMEVHSLLGPGMLESTYKRALKHELNLLNLQADAEVPISLKYKDLNIERAYFIDILVENKVVLEIKCTDALHENHIAQTITYLRHGKYDVGLILNFKEEHLRNGIRRVVLNQKHQTRK
jgi:GxxExxY protein